MRGTDTLDLVCVALYIRVYTKLCVRVDERVNGRYSMSGEFGFH